MDRSENAANRSAGNDFLLARTRPSRLPEKSATSVLRQPRGQRIIPPDALGVATRLAARRLREAKIPLEPLLKRAGLSLDQIDNKHFRIAVASQITFLELAANALRDSVLGFSLACEGDLREM